MMGKACSFELEMFINFDFLPGSCSLYDMEMTVSVWSGSREARAEFSVWT